MDAGAPHSGFSRLNFRISSRTFVATVGLPGRPRRTFEVPANPLVWPQTIKPHFWSTRIEARLSLAALAYKGRHFTCRRNSAKAQVAIPFPQCSFPIRYVTCGFPSSSKLPTEPTTRPPERMAFMVTVGSARISFQCFRNASRSERSREIKPPYNWRPDRADDRTGSPDRFRLRPLKHDYLTRTLSNGSTTERRSS